jgi:hypothetical protein
VNQDFGGDLRPFIGARVFTPLGPGVLVSVADAYLVVKLEADGIRIRFRDAGAVCLFAASVPSSVGQSYPGAPIEITESPEFNGRLDRSSGETHNRPPEADSKGLWITQGDGHPEHWDNSERKERP